MAAASLSRDWIYGVNSWIMRKIALFPDQACRGGDLDVHGADGNALGWRATAGWGCPGAVGGWPGPPPEGGAGPRAAAVRVLRAGLDRGLAGPRVVAGAAAAAGGNADGGARGDRGGVLRRGAEPGPVVGVPVDPPADLWHPQRDAVVLEQRRH